MRVILDSTGKYIDTVIKEGETDPEYDELLTVLQSAPHQDGKLARLKYPKRTWELYTPEPDDELTAEEALDILTGGVE